MPVATLPAPPTQFKPIEFSIPRRPKVEYPESDGEPMGETGLHVLATLGLFGALKFYFANRSDVYVAADMFLYYQEGKPSANTAPDVMVIKGVPNQERRIYKLWEEKVAPCTIFEVTSLSTWREDIVSKLMLYARLGVTEYYLFDPEGDYLDEQFTGFRLEDGLYTSITPEADGTLRSRELGLAFWPEGYMLRVGDPATGERILMLDEAVSRARSEAERAEQEAARAEQEAARAEQEAARAQQEATRAGQEAARAAAAEAEVARLRALIDQR